jgi:molecular chaperone GrpE
LLKQLNKSRPKHKYRENPMEPENLTPPPADIRPDGSVPVPPSGNHAAHDVDATAAAPAAQVMGEAAVAAPAAQEMGEAPVAAPAAQEIEAWKDKALRAAAELENYRRRSATEVADAKQYAITALARDMLPIADNLARALDAPEGNEAALRSGVGMVHTQLAQALVKHGVAPITVVAGEALNPELHQPMQHVPSPHPHGYVVAEVQAGYTLNGRLLRPAFVSVSSGEQLN